MTLGLPADHSSPLQAACAQETRCGPAVLLLDQAWRKIDLSALERAVQEWRSVLSDPLADAFGQDQVSATHEQMQKLQWVPLE